MEATVIDRNTQLLAKYFGTSSALVKILGKVSVVCLELEEYLENGSNVVFIVETSNFSGGTTHQKFQGSENSRIIIPFLGNKLTCLFSKNTAENA